MRRFVTLMLLAFSLSSCGSATKPETELAANPQAGGLGVLPADGVQPWEQLNAQGLVIPQANGAGDAPDRRGTSGFPAASRFARGVERFSEGGEVADFGEASTIHGLADASSFAIYRFTLGGTEPSAIAVDANLGAVAGRESSYWVGVSDYSSATWQMHGPFAEAQVAFALDSIPSYLSPFGNTFVAIVAADGNAVNVVGVTVQPFDSTDADPPPAPAAPLINPAAGGLEISWFDVVADDLAGYQIYWSYSPFTSENQNGVQQLAYLEGTNRAFLPVPQNRLVWAALRAVDVNGFLSELSPVVSARRLFDAQPPELVLDTLNVPPSVNVGEPFTLKVSGAELYDFDLDGDGNFDIVGTTSGTASIETGKAGVIRPRVRGTSSDGKAVAFGSVSLIVSGNQRPVALANAAPAYGYAPLNTNFTGSGTDFDGSVAEYAWDPDGDGIFDVMQQDLFFIYPNAGLYNVKLRATDDQGAWDVDTVAVQVLSVDASLTALPEIAERGQQHRVGPRWQRQF
jgi:hypothetical protein